MCFFLNLGLVSITSEDGSVPHSKRMVGCGYSHLSCSCLPCNHCSNQTWVVEEILAFGNKAAFYALQGVQLFETMQTRLLH